MEVTQQVEDRTLAVLGLIVLLLVYVAITVALVTAGFVKVAVVFMGVGLALLAAWVTGV